MVTRHGKVLLATLAVVAVLVAAVGTASANRLSVSNRSFRITWSAINYQGGGWEIRCDITVEGSLHAGTFTKTPGALVGYVTRATANHSCSGGGEWYFLNGTEVLEGATVTNTLPWHVRYRSFSGTLPRPTGFVVDVIGYSFLLRLSGVGCLFRSTEAAPVRWRMEMEAGGTVTGVRPDESIQIPKVAGGILCPTEICFIGLGRITLLGTTNSITANLI